MLKTVFGDNKRSQDDFLKLANQITFKNGRYNTNGGGMAFAAKLTTLMNPTTSTTENAGGSGSLLEDTGKNKSDNISAGGQRTITINIGKQIETFEVHVMNSKETAQEYENVIRESMRRVLYNINSDAR
jgi:hypothetical protein